VTGEFKAFHAEINRVEETLRGVEEKLTTDLRRVEETLTARIDGLEKRLDVVQRLAVVEAKLKEYEEKK